MGCGIVATSVHYRVYCLSVLTFIMQMHEVPGFVLDSERANLKLLIPGPAQWLPKGCVTNLHEVFGLAASFPPIATMSMAVRARAALTTVPAYRSHVHKIEAASWQEDAPLRHQWRYYYYTITNTKYRYHYNYH